MYVFLVSAKGVPIVLLLFNGGPVNVTWADRSDRVVAIMECFFPAQETGEAVLRVVTNTGNFSNPAGRLPYTWPKYQDQVRNKRVLHFAYWDCWVVFLSVGNVHIFRLNCLVNSNITATSTTNLHIPRLLYKIKPILLLIKYNSAKNKASEKKTTFIIKLHCYKNYIVFIPLVSI